MLAGLGAAIAGPAAAQGQEWRPDRPIRMILPNGAGSGADIVARALAQKLSGILGQSVVVDNQPQGVGAVGILAAARARPDGQTLMCAISSILLAPLVDPSLAYDVRSFIPVSQVHQAATVLCVSPQVPARSFTDFVALARTTPERFTLATYGHGTASHVHAALLSRRARLGVEVIHYSNGPTAIRDMAADHIRCAFLDSGSGIGSFRDGQLRPLAVSGRRRLGVLPDVPSFGELGFPGFEPAIWQAVFLPLNTPAPIVGTIAAAVRNAVATPELSERLRNIGFEPVGGTSQELAAMLIAERATWASTIAETGIRPA
ncbi:Bug family tripartite tricarboxylate transporter substrate binding protein [Siccirubricoccus deserti]